MNINGINSLKDAQILVVDDSPDTLEMLQRTLKPLGYKVLTASNVTNAIAILESTNIDLVITDFKMPKISGLELVKHVRENLRDTEIIMITGYPSINGAVEAVKAGAEDYLGKPFTDEELFKAVEKSFEKLLARRNVQKKSNILASNQFGIIGNSPKMRETLVAISKAAATTATTLITGESGTGKELVARAIHYSSARGASRFVAVNCGCIPENLLESELFGYVKGSFTGANQSRAGFFQTADGGTIFLDEISETSPAMQVKLLRVLQEKEINMIGSRRPEKIDVRIIAATNKDIYTLVKKNKFREDLYYRLNVINIDLPLLREREDDIFLLTNHFLNKFSKGDKIPRFSDAALDALGKYEWPGNIRELENLIQRTIIMVDDDVIDITDLPSYMRCSIGRNSGLNRTLEDVEAEHILNVLASVRGNKTKAAEILGIDRKTLREKLKKANPDIPETTDF